MNKQYYRFFIYFSISMIFGYLAVVAELPALLHLNATQGSDKVKKLEKKFDKFIESKLKHLDSSHDRMLNAILKVERRIKRSSANPDEKKHALNIVRNDYEYCKSTGKLPSSDELLGVAIKYAGEREGVIASIEKKRKTIINKSIKSENETVKKKLDQMEMRISNLMGGQVTLQAEDNWSGHGVESKGHGFFIKLHLTKATDSSFEGNLSITHRRNSVDFMKFHAYREGHKFIIHTTEMIRGAKQKYVIHGYIIESRMVAIMRGKNGRGKYVESRISMKK